MTNAIIIYTGNVCSTPMIEYACNNKNVLIPVREDLDGYIFQKNGFSGHDITKKIEQHLIDLYTKKKNTYLSTKTISKISYDEYIKCSDEVHTLFKWRPVFIDHKTSSGIKNIFYDFNVKPYIMVRKSIIEQAIKIYISEKVYGSRHMQFKTATMDSYEYSQFQLKQENISILLDKESLFEIKKIANNFYVRTMNNIERCFYFFKNQFKIVIAENIFQPYINEKSYNFHVQSILEDSSVCFSGEKNGMVKKAGLSIKNVINPDLALLDENLLKIEESYSGHIEKYIFYPEFENL